MTEPHTETILRRGLTIELSHYSTVKLAVETDPSDGIYRGGVTRDVQIYIYRVENLITMWRDIWRIVVERDFVVGFAWRDRWAAVVAEPRTSESADATRARMLSVLTDLLVP